MARKPALTAPYFSTDTLAIGTTTENTSQAHLARAICHSVVISGTYTVTGGVTTGKSLNDAIQRLVVGSLSRPIFDAYASEADVELQAMRQGTFAGDPGLTTAMVVGTPQPFTITVEFSDGEIDLSQYASPIVYIDVNPAVLDATLTGFSLSARVVQTQARGTNGRKVNRSFANGNLAPQFYLGPDPVDNVFLYTFANGGILTLAQLPNADGKGVRAQAITAQDVANIAAQAYIWNNLAVPASPVRYAFIGVASGPSPTRYLATTLSSAQAVAVFAIGPG